MDDNVTAGAKVGDLNTEETFTYAFVDDENFPDNASFTISDNAITINASPDFETKSSYSIRLKTTAQGGLSFEKDFTITINDLSYVPLLTFENINKTYGDINFDLGATSNSTGIISYSVVEGTGEVILPGITN